MFFRKKKNSINEINAYFIKNKNMANLTYPLFLETEDMSPCYKNEKIDVLNLFDLIVNAKVDCEKLKIKVKNFCVVMLGKRYNQWLEQNKKELDTLQNRLNYYLSLSIEEIQKEWEINGGQVNYQTMLLPFLVMKPEPFGGETHISLSIDDRNKISNFLKKELDIDTIEISKYVLSTNMIEDNIENIESINIEKLETGKEISLGKLETQKFNDKVNVQFFSIFVTIKNETPSCIFSTNETNMKEYQIERTTVNTAELFSLCASNIKNCVTNNKENNQLVILPITEILVYFDEIELIQEYYLNFLKQEFPKSNNVKLNIL